MKLLIHVQKCPENNHWLGRLFFAGFFIVSAFLLVTPQAQATILNGDFETGNLEGWTMQENYMEVSNSNLVDCTPFGDEGYVATLLTGYTDYGVYVSSLLQENLTIADLAFELVFDYRIADIGPDPGGGGGGFLDQLSVSFLSDKGNIDPLLAVDMDGITLEPLYVKSTENIGGGFVRVVTDISLFAGASNTSIIFDLYDENDGRLTRVDVDNVNIIIPEPASILFTILGIVILHRSRRSES